MAKPLELTISTKYVPNWGIWEGIREIVQNALDARDCRGATFDLRYDPTYSNLIIESKGVTLDRQTLLLGESDKVGNSAARGHFGEGYKLAWLALLRAGLSIRVDTGSERWEPAVVKSETFGGAEVIAVNIKQRNLKDGIYNGVKVVISPVSKEDMAHVRDRVLEFNKPEKVIPCGYRGQVLLDERFAGLLFAKGLFVGRLGSGYRYGYDFHTIELDRDRKMADPWSLRFNVRACIEEAVRSESLSPETVFDLLNSEGGEAEAVREFSSHVSRDFATKLADVFQARYGSESVPVASTGESLEADQVGLRGIVMQEGARAVVAQVLGSLAEKKVTAETDVVTRYGLSDMTAEEKANLLRVAELIEKHGGLTDFGLRSVTVAEFRSATLDGKYQNGMIYVAKRLLSDPTELLACLVHEACHNEVKGARDGEIAHRNSVEHTLARIALRPF